MAKMGCVYKPQVNDYEKQQDHQPGNLPAERKGHYGGHNKNHNPGPKDDI